MPDILFVCKDDWANVAWTFQQSCRAVGLDALAVKARKHPFCYPEEAYIYQTQDELSSLAKDAGIIVFMHSEHIDLGIDTKNKASFVFHGGTRYRRFPDACNQWFNPIVQATLIQSRYLWNEGAKNPIWVVPPVDVNRIKRFICPAQRGKRKFAHYPRGASLKGTDTINKIMQRFQRSIPARFSYDYSAQMIPWEENLQRIARCDVYLNSMQLLLDGKRHGAWGVTALEAAALGRVVVTAFHFHKIFEKTFGKCPFVATNDPLAFEREVMHLIMMPQEGLTQLQRQSGQWVRDCFSFEAAGQRFKEIFN
jgi:hypothetical protein